MIKGILAFGRTAMFMAGRAIAPFIRYPSILLTALGACLGFKILNFSKVYGQKNCRLKHSMAIVSNHQALMDSFAVGINVYTPQIFWQPNLLPWHLADRKNFFTKRYLRPFMRLWKGIPVGQGGAGIRRDFSAFQQTVQILKEGGTVHIFLEGKRSPNEEILPAVEAIGGIILLSQASVLPVYFTGMHQIQPYRKNPGDPPKTWLRLFGSYFEWYFDLRFGHKLTIMVGPEITPKEIQQWIKGELDFKKRSALVTVRLRQALLNLRDKALF